MKNLKESSLTRLLSKMENNDCGSITAYRSEYTKSENQQRNRSLLAKLQNLRYGVTSVKGSYIENFGTPEAIEVGEHVFFVEDKENKGKLEKDLRELGEEFDQDSILFIPKGGEKSYLWGTNKKNPEAYPKYGVSKELPNRTFGKENEFMTKVKGRPFSYNEAVKEHTLPANSFGKKGCSIYAKMNWKDVDIIKEWEQIFNFTKKKLKEEKSWIVKKGYK